MYECLWGLNCNPFECIPNMELLDHMVILFLIFWETTFLFSTITVPCHSHQQCTRFAISLHSHQLLFFFVLFRLIVGILAGVSEMWKSLSDVRLLATLWTVESVEFSRPEYWSGQPFPSPGNLPNPGMHFANDQWCARVLSCFSCVWLCDPVTVAPRLLCSWDSPGKNTGVGCHALLQGIFFT